jgi:hypothetical protein
MGLIFNSDDDEKMQLGAEITFGSLDFCRRLALELASARTRTTHAREGTIAFHLHVPHQARGRSGS